MEYLNLGSSPSNEDCAQVGREGYQEMARLECNLYIEQLHRLYPAPQLSRCGFRAKSFPHDFGNYWEVVVTYDPDDESSVKFAFMVESGCPKEWDPEAKHAMKHPRFQRTMTKYLKGGRGGV
jgi:hypothetical protein